MILGNNRLDSIISNAETVDRTVPPPWSFSHSQWTDKVGAQIATLYGHGGRLGSYLYYLQPNIARELVRGYRVYKYLRAQHTALVEECEMTIGPEPK